MEINPLVLIVYSDSRQRLPMRQALQQVGFRVEEAENGYQAWALLLDEHPALVISDVGMPGMDGFALCRLVRHNAEFALLPMVIIISPDDISAINRAYRVGATDVIAKPVDCSLLGHRVHQILHATPIPQI